MTRPLPDIDSLWVTIREVALFTTPSVAVIVPKRTVLHVTNNHGGLSGQVQVTNMATAENHWVFWDDDCLLPMSDPATQWALENTMPQDDNHTDDNDY